MGEFAANSLDVESRAVLGVSVTCISLSRLTDLVISSAREGVGGSICFCNVHSIVTSTRNSALRDSLGRALIRAPDGAPVAWMLRRMGVVEQERVDGPSSMIDICKAAAVHSLPVYLYGSTPAVLDALVERLSREAPGLVVAGSVSPPFGHRPPTAVAEDIELIRSSGARIVFVGLGCPKQEVWMGEAVDRLDAILLGVGAAFDYHALTLRRAPKWAQKSGLEWLYRLIMEPRRLFWRYLDTNSVFLMKAVIPVLLGGRFRASRDSRT